MDRVKGKVAIVTGAASGMGWADAILLASDESHFVNGTEMVIDNGATITPPTPTV